MLKAAVPVLFKVTVTGELVVPADTPTVQLSLTDGAAPTLDLIVQVGFAASKTEARKLVEERGIRLNGQPLEDPLGRITVTTGDILQRGKRKFVRLALK